MSYIDDIFERGGILDKELPGYEVRPGQVELVRAFDRAIGAGRPLVAEGPCGVGKSFAYLAAAIYHTAALKKGRTVVVTANIALQEQLVEKDLPLLHKVLSWPFTFALSKGRNNYLCARKRHKLETELSFDGEGLPKPHDDMKEIEFTELRSAWSWMVNTSSGDQSDCETGVGRIWPKVSSTSDECIRKGCEFYVTCYANRARARAQAADVVVMNYHMRFVGGGVNTPAHNILICDEAHELETIARDFFGWTITFGQIKRVSDWVRRYLPKEEEALAAGLRKEGDNLFNHVRKGLGKYSTTQRITKKDWYDSESLLVGLRCALEHIDDRLEVLEEMLSVHLQKEEKQRLGELKAQTTLAGKAAHALISHLTAVNELTEGWVFWTGVVKETQRYTIEARPVEVAKRLSEMLYPTAAISSLLISATMTAGNSFQYLRKQLGVPEEAGELIVPSPFDLRTQGLLFVPSEMAPPPKYGDAESEKAFQDGLVFHAEQLLEMCGGRCLLLFSSWKNLNYVYEELSKSVGDQYKLLKQGHKQRTHLLKEFREDETSVLLGVKSFWTGVDVPGNSLIGLLIDKIPFGVPSDPVNQAISELLEKRGKNIFMERTLPEAIIDLRQGAGRLIRAKTDVGVVVLTDTRLLTTGYGETIVNSLPEFRKVRSLAKAREFAKQILGA